MLRASAAHNRIKIPDSDTTGLNCHTGGNGDEMAGLVKNALEKLSNIGTVTVKCTAPSNDNTESSLMITFDTNAGNLDTVVVGAGPSAVAIANPAPALQGVEDGTLTCAGATAEAKVTAGGLSGTRDGTSTILGGKFSVELSGQRTGYLSHDVSEDTLKEALETLSTVGTVEVSRSNVDDSGGYTWSVTFMNDLGDVPEMTVDDITMTGTVATAVVVEKTKGEEPAFNQATARCAVFARSTGCFVVVFCTYFL